MSFIIQNLFCIFQKFFSRPGRGFTAPFLRLRGYCRGKNRAFARSDVMLRTLKRRLQEPGLSVAAMRRSFLANLRFSK